MSGQRQPVTPIGGSFYDRVRAFEIELVRAAMPPGVTRAEAARRLGLSKATLQSILGRLSLTEAAAEPPDPLSLVFFLVTPYGGYERAISFDGPGPFRRNSYELTDRYGHVETISRVALVDYLRAGYFRIEARTPPRVAMEKTA